LHACRSTLEDPLMGFTIGWLSENMAKIKALDWSTPLSMISSTFWSVWMLAKFWLMNIGVIIVPFTIGLLKSDRFVRQFYSPYIALFVLGNIIRFQPWNWDKYVFSFHPSNKFYC
jgi:hypothetical protein